MGERRGSAVRQRGGEESERCTRGEKKRRNECGQSERVSKKTGREVKEAGKETIGGERRAEKK